METTAAPRAVEMETTGSGPATVVDRARARWSGMAGRLGMGFCVLGFFVIAVAWNGAAGLDYTQGQLPYLISGGVGGLGLIVIGASLMIAESNRRDRAMLERKLDELTASVGRLSLPSSTNGGRRSAADDTLVAVGRTSYHRRGCRLVEGRANAPLIPLDEAVERGLARCRVCNP